MPCYSSLTRLCTLYSASSIAELTFWLFCVNIRGKQQEPQNMKKAMKALAWLICLPFKLVSAILFGRWTTYLLWIALSSVIVPLVLFACGVMEPLVLYVAFIVNALFAVKFWIHPIWWITPAPKSNEVVVLQNRLSPLTVGVIPALTFRRGGFFLRRLKLPWEVEERRLDPTTKVELSPTYDQEFQGQNGSVTWNVVLENDPNHYQELFSVSFDERRRKEIIARWFEGLLKSVSANVMGTTPITDALTDKEVLANSVKEKIKNSELHGYGIRIKSLTLEDVNLTKGVIEAREVGVKSKAFTEAAIAQVTASGLTSGTPEFSTQLDIVYSRLMAMADDNSSLNVHEIHGLPAGLTQLGVGGITPIQGGGGQGGGNRQQRSGGGRRNNRRN